jgi:hypothetical protein
VEQDALSEGVRLIVAQCCVESLEWLPSYTPTTVRSKSVVPEIVQCAAGTQSVTIKDHDSSPWGCKIGGTITFRENIMKTNRLFALAIGAILLIGTIAGITSASAQKTSNSSTAKLWLTAMDKDNDGTVSKEEFTAYMQAQFDKADTDHDGTLDRTELEQLRKNLGIATK